MKIATMTTWAHFRQSKEDCAGKIIGSADVSMMMSGSLLLLSLCDNGVVTKMPNGDDEEGKIIRNRMSVD